MDANPPSPMTFDAPPAPAGRRGDLLVVILLLIGFVVLFHVLPKSSEKTTNDALTETLSADAAAKINLMFQSIDYTGTAQLTSDRAWRTVELQYRTALQDDPRVARARRGLAASLWLRGNKRAATRVMQGPADVPAEGATAWKAAQAAFGALPRPHDAGTLKRYRTALKRRELGWSGTVALEALADSKAQAAEIRGARAREFAWPLLIRLGTLFILGLLTLGTGVVLWIVYLSNPSPSRLPPLTISWTLLVEGFFLAFFLQFGPPVLVETAFGRQLERLDSGAKLVASLALTVLGAVLAAVVVNRWLKARGGGLDRFGFSGRMAPVWGVAAYAATVPLLGVFAVLMTSLQKAFPDVSTPANPAAFMAVAAHGWQLVVVFLTVCVAAPIVEETLFRGFLFRALGQRVGIPAAALLSSAVFAGLHPQLPWGFPPLFGIALVLCYLYRATGSLVPGMIMHGLNNTAALIASITLMGHVR